MVGQHRELHLLQEPDAAQGAVATPPASGPAAAAIHPEALQHHRIAPLQDLRIGQASIGHVGVHRGGAVVTGTGPRPAADRLVVLVAVVAEQDVVHRPLALRRYSEGAEQGVCDRLAGLHVSGRHRRRVLGGQHRILRDDDADRLQAPFVERDVVLDEAAEDVQHRGTRHRGRSVEVVGPLRARAGEVDRRLPSHLVEGDAHPDEAAVVHRERELAVPHHVDHPANLLLRVALDVLHVGVHDVEAEVPDHPAHFPDALLARRDLGL